MRSQRPAQRQPVAAHAQPLGAKRCLLMSIRAWGDFRCPVVILARLAVSRENHGRGLGVGMLQDAARFTTRFGFSASPLRQQQLLLLLKDAKKILL